jgi:acyl-CoA synthetase (AMP-forming)/AMP-acid ligase II
MNLFSILDRSAGKWPNVIAVVDHRHRMTYREIHVAAESLARELQKAAIREGDKVGLLFPRGVEDIVACFAVARRGGIVVQISPASKTAELDGLSKKLGFDGLTYNQNVLDVISTSGEKSFFTSALSRARSSDERTAPILGDAGSQSSRARSFRK